MRTIKEQTELLAQKKTNFDKQCQYLEDNNIAHLNDKRTLERVYKEGLLEVWKETRVDTKGRIWINFTSSCHWTSEVIELRWDKTYGDKNFSWDVSYGSGGTVSCRPTELAKVMEVMWQLTKEELS